LPARAFAGFSRYHLPLGATAVLAITFLSVREYQTVTPEGVVLPVLGGEVFETSASSAGSAATVAGPAEGAFLGGEVKPVAVASESAPSVSREVDDSVREASPSARSIANNFAAVQSAESPFGGRSFLGSTVHGFESRAMPARQPVVDPLAQMKAPSDVRRARYLGTALPASVGVKTATARSSERLASRIADERLYETGPSRLGVGGDRLMVKF
jgi:hypothetical protein